MCFATFLPTVNSKSICKMVNAFLKQTSVFTVQSLIQGPYRCQILGGMYVTFPQFLSLQCYLAA
jgi:hypothetical protein